MVEYIAVNDTGHFRNRAPFLFAVVPGARVPATEPIDVNLSADVAVTRSSPGDNGDRIQMVVHALEAPVHLYSQQLLERRSRPKPGPRG